MCNECSDSGGDSGGDGGDAGDNWGAAAVYADVPATRGACSPSKS